MIARRNMLDNVSYVFGNSFRRDAMGFVIGNLLVSPAICFINCFPHRASDCIGVQNDPPFCVARRPADRLHQRSLRPQKAFFVCVQDRDKSTLRNIQTFAQQVDADQHIKRTQPQIPDNFNTLQCVDIRVHVANLHAVFVQIFG